METESKKLLKQGITSLLPENTDIFKQNIPSIDDRQFR